MTLQQNKVEALKATGMSEAEIADLQEFLANKERREKLAEANKIATDMVQKGKFAQRYAELNDQLDALWDKAIEEAHTQVGIVIEKPESKKHNKKGK